MVVLQVVRVLAGFPYTIEYSHSQKTFSLLFRTTFTAKFSLLMRWLISANTMTKRFVDVDLHTGN